jgi:serine/threonine protein phosphatase PrpC
MWKSIEPRFDVASGLATGARDNQEDAITTEFHAGCDEGFAILADGMGGHGSGEVASRLILSSMLYSLKAASERFLEIGEDVPKALRAAATKANDELGKHAKSSADRDMGATLLAIATIGERLHWISIGDSLLYLFRNGDLIRLNEDHSMAQQIDFMAEKGLIDEDAAKDHPDRNSLTSAVCGKPIKKLDCPDAPMELEKDDLILMASDGLATLSDNEIAKVLQKNRKRSSAEMVMLLLAAVEGKKDKTQDNVSIGLVRVGHARPATLCAPRKPSEDDVDVIEVPLETAAE